MYGNGWFYESSEAPTFAVQPTQQNERPSLQRRPIILWILIIIFFVLLVAFFISNRDTVIDYAFYIKDDELYITRTDKIEPWQVTTRLLEKDYSLRKAQFLSDFNLYMHLSKDGQKLFYIDKVDNTDSFSLYYRYISMPNQKPVKIDSEITAYAVSDSGNLVTYSKGYNGSLINIGTLYQHNLVDRAKIATDVFRFGVSDDGTKIGYMNSEDDIYLQCLGKNKEKIESDVSYVYYVNDACDIGYYKKDGALYRITVGGEKEKIAADIYEVYAVYETGEIYYTRKTDSAGVPLLDFVEDDMREIDADMTEPVVPTAPNRSDYYTIPKSTYSLFSPYDFDENAYQTALEQYNAQYETYWINMSEWQKKQRRDKLREDLANTVVRTDALELCYYDGEKETVLTDAFKSKGKYSENEPVFVFSVYNPTSVPRIILSEIDSVLETENMVKHAIVYPAEICVAVKGNVIMVEEQDATDFVFSPDGKTIYYLADSSVYGEQNLYEMRAYANGEFYTGRFDTDVYAIKMLKNGKLVYIKDFVVKGTHDGSQDGIPGANAYTGAEIQIGRGDLYMDGKRIDYDVKCHARFQFHYVDDVDYIEDYDALIYFVDWDAERNCGTLKMYKDEETLKIADDVASCKLTREGQLLYLHDYSIKSQRGDLYIYKNGKSLKIDDDVSNIVEVADYKYLGKSVWFRY